MRVNLCEQEYLSIKQIAEEWAKEPGKLQYKEMEQEIWKAYWLGQFVDENGEPTFMVTYEGKEYYDKQLPIHIVPESNEEKYDKESIEYLAIIYKEEGGGSIPIHFWIRYLYSSPTSVSISRFYPHIIISDERNEAAEKKYEDEFLSGIKDIIAKYKDGGKAYLSLEDDFVQRYLLDHVVELPYKRVTKYVPLHRAFLFSYLHSSGLLEFRPKRLPKWSGKGEDAILMEADEEDYKSLTEQDLIFLDKNFENKQFLQAYLNPCIKPEYFIDACVKLNVKVPQFLAPLVRK